MKRTTMALVTLLLVVSTGIAADTQRSQWKTLSDESWSLYQQGRYDRAVVVAQKGVAGRRANPRPG